MTVFSLFFKLRTIYYVIFYILIYVLFFQVEEEDQQPRSQSVEDMLDNSSRSPSPPRLQRTVSEEQLSAPQRRRSFRHQPTPPPEDPQDDLSETASSAAASSSAGEAKKRNFVDRLASKVRSMMRKWPQHLLLHPESLFVVSFKLLSTIGTLPSARVKMNLVFWIEHHTSDGILGKHGPFSVRCEASLWSWLISVLLKASHILLRGLANWSRENEPSQYFPSAKDARSWCPCIHGDNLHLRAEKGGQPPVRNFYQIPGSRRGHQCKLEYYTIRRRESEMNRSERSAHVN